MDIICFDSFAQWAFTQCVTNGHTISAIKNKNGENINYINENTGEYFLPNKYVTATITATVKTQILLEDSETLDDFKQRYVDIYLHGAGERGYTNKIDLGADQVTIKIEESN